MTDMSGISAMLALQLPDLQPPHPQDVGTFDVADRSLANSEEVHF